MLRQPLSLYMLIIKLPENTNNKNESTLIMCETQSGGHRVDGVVTAFSFTTCSSTVLMLPHLRASAKPRLENSRHLSRRGAQANSD